MRTATYEVEQAVSPRHWWFQGRRRILARLLADLPLPRPALILDAGCGTGANAALLARHGIPVGVDASRVPLGSGRPGSRLQARVEDLPFGDGAFDLVIALDLLEHLDDDLAGARELCRVLRPRRGRGLFFVPALRLLWGLQDDVSEHRRRYTPQSLRAVLSRAGFRIHRLSYFNLLLFAPVLAGRLAMRIWRPPIASENQLSHPLLDPVLGRIFGAEAPLLARFDLPLGVSLLALVERA